MLSTIGRFKIKKILGKGAQGIVYLADDPILDRQVAIKTLHQEFLKKNPSFNDLLMEEAKLISQMKHPNIVSIFEAGEDNHIPFLVFEYIIGETLTEVIKSNKYENILDVLNLFRSICLGMQHSHQLNIIHGDLKPDNIILDENGIPKIMDFGIAKFLSQQKTTADIYGTPRYMPPEYLSDRMVSASNDVYALGLILYEMITATVAVQGKTIKQIIYNILHKKITLPSSYNQEIGEIFEHIVVKAIEHKRLNRYQSMQEMIDAIDQYQEKFYQIKPSSKQQDAAITFLMRKLKHHQDFPALSESLIKINSLVDDEDTDSAQLASVIAEDFALTTKILKLVNSAYYHGLHTEISTISQAVLILGFDEIRVIGMSLMLIEHLHNKSKAKNLKNQIISSIFCGILSKDLSYEINLKQPEEAFLSGTFFQLGELLSLYYFHEEAAEINRLIREESLSKKQAAIKVLGITYQRLGIEIAKQWHLPNYIIKSMMPFVCDEFSAKYSLNESEKLRAVTSLSNDLAAVLENKRDQNWRHSAISVWKNYAQVLPLDNDALISFAEQARDNLIDMNFLFNIRLSESELIKKVPLIKEDEEQKSSSEIVKKKIKAKPINPQDILTKALLEINKEIKDKNKFNHIISILMTALYKAFNLERLVVCFYNAKTHEMRAKMGHGISDKFLQAFNFFLQHPVDLFQVSCTRGVDIYINDTAEFEQHNNLPAWYRQIIDAETFMIFPIMLDKKPFAMIYLDNNRKNELVIGQDYLKQLQILRGLCVKSIKKKYK